MQTEEPNQVWNNLANRHKIEEAAQITKDKNIVARVFSAWTETTISAREIYAELDGYGWLYGDYGLVAMIRYRDPIRKRICMSIYLAKIVKGWFGRTKRVFYQREIASAKELAEAIANWVPAGKQGVSINMYYAAEVRDAVATAVIDKEAFNRS